ncbi:PREDICTED: UDP-glycosyltransferase 83A1-like [Fragaria vesca subsp. vesca]|uniref:UDP-glycosyltransferase 83A1-like n=1 Tax=Fragaria vesca subsp. vesca TaxID=101020 RepID=UPI0002C30529|nr:PREDICTED: UDP-glycosyltransferase 83A1-like [Fragaria vesca subsp. vesca]
MSKPHIIAIPLPAQGHVMPLMEFSQCLAHHGFRVTFVNTETIHKKIVNAMANENHIRHDHVHLVSIPDGLETEEDRNGPGVLSEAIQAVLHQNLEEIIEKINKEEDEKITCLIADESCGWALEVAQKMKIVKVAAFWPAAAATLVLNFCIPNLVHEGIIDDEGTVLKSQMVQLAPKMPMIKSANFVWACADVSVRKILFHFLERANKNAKLVDWLVCNSAYEIEPTAIALEPQILPIGPLLASSRLGNSAGSLWPTDSTCLKWLDEQPPCSVIYVAFGSTALFNQTQFHELALALELSNKPFLWVVRPDISDSIPYPEGYKERVGSKGLMVGWAPQQKVLAHPSIACFLSHCGWNSTIEGVSNGVPFLCWPYFADQFINESYIRDVWNVGLGFDKNESGIITRGEIKKKVEHLLGDEVFKARASKLKEMAVATIKEGGQSNKIFKKFIEWIKS